MMRKSFVVMSAIVLCGVLRAQSVVGSWQGTLPVAEYPRVIVKITANENGSLRGVFYRIDHDASSIPFSTVSFKAPDVSIASDLIDTSFQGKLSADGKSIAGTWTQSKHAYPVTLALATAETLWTYPGATHLAAMSETADPSFEVATIKPSEPHVPQRGNTRTRQISLKSYTLLDMIEFAYQVRSRQIDGSGVKADWLDESRFDIAGEPDVEGQPSAAQVRTMMKKLLAERFGLKVHSMDRVMPVYVLTRGPAGSRGASAITKSDPTENSHPRIFTKLGADGQMRVQFTYVSMTEFAGMLMNFIKDRQILDQTGLSGSFDFSIRLPPEAVQAAQVAPPTDGVSDAATGFFDSVSQVGLKLEPKKAPVEVIVIDHLETPSAN